MIHIRLKSLLPFFLLILAWPAIAKDVTTEQYKMTAAQHEYEDALSSHEAAAKLVKEQEKRLSQEQALLEKLRQKQTAAKAALDKAKARVDQQEKILNDAWNEGK